MSILRRIADWLAPVEPHWSDGLAVSTLDKADWPTGRDLCMTQGCPSPWTHDVHGWKTCSHHAATAARV